MKNVWRVVWVLCAALLVATACDGNGTNGGATPEPQENPIPQLSGIAPVSSVAHLPAFTLTVTGADFVEGAAIVFNGVEMDTAYVSAGELTCTVLPEDTLLASLSAADSVGPAVDSQAVPVRVRNPTPGGGDSQSVDFTVYANHRFSNPRNLSQSAGISFHPDVAAAGDGEVCIVWYDDTSGNDEILFRGSIDGGQTWSSAVNISDNGGISYSPVIGMGPDGRRHAAWSDTSINNKEVFYSRSTDGGATWRPFVDMTHNSGRSEESEIAVGSDGTVYLVWADMTPGNFDIFFVRSVDGGVTWSAIKNISHNSAGSSWPCIAVNGSGHINVAWNDYTTGVRRVFFSRSVDNGQTWSQAVNVYNHDDQSGYPSIAVNGQGDILLACTFSQHNERSLYFSRSSDNGGTWSQPVSIAPQSQDPVFPRLAVDGADNINMVWWDQTQGARGVYFSRSLDNGVTWSEAMEINNFNVEFPFPRIAVDETGKVYVVWVAASREVHFSASR